MRTRLFLGVIGIVLWGLLGVRHAGAQSDLKIEPIDGLNFGNVGIGESVTANFTLTNLGNALIKGTATIDSGDSQSFEVLAGTSDYEIIPGKSVVVTVEFAPLSEGDGKEATVKFTGAATVTRPVRGNGANPPDFTDVEDILEGRRRILVVNDLLLSNGSSGEVRGLKVFEETLWTFQMDRSLVVEGPTKELMVEERCDRQPQGAQTRILRMFNLENDIILTLTLTIPTPVGIGCRWVQFLMQDPVTPGNDFDIIKEMSGSWLQAAKGDFDKDGFEDLLVINDEQAFVAAALPCPEGADVTFCEGVQPPSAGLRFGQALSTSSRGVAMNEPTVGDLDFDGNLEVAWVGGSTADGSGIFVNVATVCTGFIDGPRCAGKAAFEMVLWEQQIPVNVGSETVKVQEGASELSQYPPVAVAAGSYTDAAADTLLLTAASPDEKSVQIWSWNASAGAFQLLAESKEEVHGMAATMATGAEIDWFADSEQGLVVWSGTNVSGQKFFEIAAIRGIADGGVLRQSLTYTQSNFVKNVDFGALRLAGVAAGRFTKELQTIDNEVVPSDEFNLKWAVLYQDPSGGNSVLEIYRAKNASGRDFTPTVFSRKTFPGINIRFLDNYLSFGSRLRAGDLEGLSLRLGEPILLRPNRLQPNQIIGKPPMHADYVKCSICLKPELVNFTGNQQDFVVEYSFGTAGQDSQSTERKTSYAWSFKETTGITVAFKFPAPPNVAGGETKPSSNGLALEQNFAWGETSKETVADKFDTYTKWSTELKTVTRGSDAVFVMGHTMNYYLYPVLGHEMCEDGLDACTEDKKRPLYLIVSGPDHTKEDDAGKPALFNGVLLPWYQPRYQPLNLLSYPWNLGQLRIDWPDLATGDPQLSTGQIVIQNLGQESTFKWSQEQTQAQTAATVNTDFFDSSTSITIGNPKAKEQGGFAFTQGFDYGSSNSFENLNTSVQRMDATEGIKLSFNPANFQDQQNNYCIRGYILGQTLVNVAQNLTTVGNIQTQGALTLLWTVDLTGASGCSMGPFWDTTPYRDHIDIALNHPSAMIMDTSRLGADQKPLNCLSVNVKDTNKLSCVLVAGPESFSELWNSQFFWTKGLFISVGGSSGPQRDIAEDGALVTLRQRVLNLALKDMDESHRVRVRFYVQEMDSRKRPVGDSVQIGDDVVLEPIPGFQSTQFPNSPNYRVAETQWDTTGFGGIAGKDYLVWVIAWAETEEGELVPDLEAHGLTEVPGELTSISCFHTAPGDPDCKDPPMEMITLDACETMEAAGHKIFACGVNPEVPTSVSNNFGYYRGLFTVVPSALALAGVEEAEQNVALEIRGAAVSKAKTQLQRELPESTGSFAEGRWVEVTAEIHAPSDAMEGVIVEVYDGEDNLEERKPFDADIIPMIAGGGFELVRSTYRPEGCGARDIVVSARSNAGKGVRSEARIPFVVPCELEVNGPAQGKAKKVGSSRVSKGKFYMTFDYDLEEGEEIDLSRAEVTLLGFLEEFGGKELVRDGTGHAVTPMTLTVKKRNANKAVFVGKSANGGPKVKLKVKRGRHGDSVKVHIAANRLEIDAPERCGAEGGRSTVLLETSLMLNDGVNGSRVARMFDKWECLVKKGKVKKLKSLADGS